MPTYSFGKTPALLIDLYETKRSIFKEVHVYSDRFDHYMQRHVSHVLFPDKSKVLNGIDADYLITETLTYGIPVGYTNGRLELRLHFPMTIGHGFFGQEAHYTVLILEACERHWKFINFFVDVCPFSAELRIKKCHWKHHHHRYYQEKKNGTAVELCPNVEQGYDVFDRTVLYEIKNRRFTGKDHYSCEREGNILFKILSSYFYFFYFSKTE